MSDGNTVNLMAGAPVVQVPPGFTPSAVPPPAPVAAPVAAPDAGATVTLPAQPPAAAAPAPVGAAPVEAAPEPVAAESFAKAAQTDLDKANVALDAVDKGAVQLDLDKQGVDDLLKLISQARSLVDNVHSRAVNNLDVELKFGNNWVSDAISRRLREVAVGNEESAVNVIGDFMQVLFEVEETIREAARNLEQADDEAADAFGAAGEAKG
ncbi:hypothetical protein ACFFSW_19365 [Saccharothrix longispora]|uniref:Polyhydroxyalkanoate synthesis regulator phasin n=1 Tax=Saccharothrix longispora TaxID=33920 RepID=A0ABU1Q3U4_9PSEU|nr:hypothetical protein [Saccharothrix longispora]MDR6597567.1 polyhydroxyalkanoate synthesis regulator phasin [Saccharothrix longispora]